MLLCAQSAHLNGVKLFSLLDGRRLRYDAEIVGELETHGGCHGIKRGETACECGWSPEEPIIKTPNVHPTTAGIR